MLKFICQTAIPRFMGSSYLCHADPDALSRIQKAASGASSQTVAALSDVFSNVLKDTRVGGVWKKTRPGRLMLAERALVSQLKGSRAGVAVLDLGASDGSTTAGLWRAMTAANIPVETLMLADLYIWLERWTNGSLMEYRSTDGQPVLARWGRIGLRLPTSEHRWDFFGTWIAELYLHHVGAREGLERTGRIAMISPLATEIEAIDIVELDCLEYRPEMVSRFDAIRASNILNRDYFSTAQLKQILNNLACYLKPDGLLVVSRNIGFNNDETEHGGAWRLVDGGFQLVGSFGDGSEIAAIIDAFQRLPETSPLRTTEVDAR